MEVNALSKLARKPHIAAEKYVNQHYVPRFLLSQWESGDDGKVTAFRWVDHRLISSRRKAKSVAKLAHLYSTQRSTEAPDVSLERDYLGPRIDGPSALAHAALLTGGVENLDVNERVTWAQFLATQLIRVPHQMAQIRDDARKLVLSKLESVSGVVDDETLNLPILNDFAVKAFPWIVNSTRLAGTLEHATWAVRRFDATASNLLIGDNPLCLEGRMADTFMYALPLSPSVMFYAFNDHTLYAHLQDASEEDMIIVHNLDQLDTAEQAVFAVDDRHTTLIAAHLRRPQSIATSD